MAQNITLLGASYTDVPAVELPKTGGGTASFTDVTPTTAVATDVLDGKYFFTAQGVLTLGTNQGGSGDGYVWQDQDGYVHLSDEQGTSVTVEALSVTQNGTYTAPTGKAYSPVSVNVSGGGGLEYETGTWTPTEDVASAIIPFSDTHTVAPFHYEVSDASETYSDVLDSNYRVSYTHWGQVYGEGERPSDSQINYGRVEYIYRGTNPSNFSSGNTGIYYPISDTGDSSASYPRYWATETGIKAYSNTTSRYWRAGRTYKWIAVWTPTT